MAKQRKSDRSGTSAKLGFEAKLWMAAKKLRHNMAAAERGRGSETTEFHIDWRPSARYITNRRPAGPLSQDTPNFGGFFFAPGVAA